jgi:hypothetical protein
MMSRIASRRARELALLQAVRLDLLGQQVMAAISTFSSSV